jgi:pSer/pThr/pTyr-binding forkhead associated (FHA) protein
MTGETPTKTIAAYLEDCQNLSLEDFEAKHGRAFLVHHGPIGKLRKPRADDDTLAEVTTDSQAGGQFVPERDFLVFQVELPVAGAVAPEVYWVGRSDANEVVVPDVSVSEVHAFVLYEQGGFTIQDTGSRNGTRVDNVKVLPQGLGDPTPLPSGSRVRFGAVKMTFLLAEQFRALVLGLLG